MLHTDTYDKFSSRINSQIDFLRTKIAEIKPKSVILPSMSSTPVEIPQVNFSHVKTPKLKIGSFSDNTKDPFAFYKFISNFNNAMDCLPGISGQQKFAYYIKNSLSGKAFSMVEKLPITSDNFAIANDLLNSEFLDENLLVDSIWQSLFYHKKCVNLAENSEFITLFKCKIQELERFELSFKSENNPQIVAHSMC